MQTIEIRSAKVTFDKEKTKAYRTAFHQPCDREEEYFRICVEGDISCEADP